MTIILYMAVAISLISMYITVRTGTKPNKNILMSISLPHDKLDLQVVKEIVRQYNRYNNILFVILVAVSVPIFFIRKYPSLSIVYMFILIAIVIVSSNKLFYLYSKKLSKLKKENGWIVGTQYLISVDTEVARFKDKMPIAKKWFIPAFVIYLITILIALSKINEYGYSLLITSLIELLIMFFYLYLYWFTTHHKSAVYSENTQVNTACTFCYKRYWSVCWVICATIQSIQMLIFMVSHSSTWSIIPILVILLSYYITYCKVRDAQNRLIATCETPVYVDDDEYWKNGYYNNPYDMKLTVEKRVGIGYTYNMATTKGNLIVYGSLALAVVVVVGLMTMLFAFDFVKMSVVQNGNMITIDAPMYGYSFNTSDIEEVKLIDELPAMSKSNGAGTDRYKMGFYNVSGYRKVRMFVYTASPRYIVIDLKGDTVFLSGETAEQTESYYKLLTQNDMVALK